jgi:hypothetical protein
MGTRTTILMTVAVSLVGCRGSGLPFGEGADLAVSSDMAVASDLAVAPDLAARDLAVGADLAVGTDLAVVEDLAIRTYFDMAHVDMSAPLMPQCMPAGGPLHSQFVWNNVIVPMQRMDYAFDLNGDGRVDNQLGNIEGALAGQNIDVQAQASLAVTSGRSLTLLDEHADAVDNDDCAAVDVEEATAMASPDFSGAGHFTVDAAELPGHFAGPIVAGKFSSQPAPIYAAAPVVMMLNLPLLEAVTAVHVVGAHVEYTRAADGTVTGGQLNGAIKNAEVQGTLIPNIAVALTAKISDDLNSSGGLTPSDMQILNVFDNGGKADASCSDGTCKNPNGTCSVKGDNKIDVCEVSTAGLIQNLLAPDVQMFDAAGNLHPSPENTNKDSLSIGLHFTVVPATF